MNIKKVNDGLYRGSAPTCLNDVIKLKNQGFTNVLNLQRGVFDFIHGIPETQWVESLGMTMCHIAESFIFPPSYQDLLASVQYIERAPKVYVHCKDGVDRTGLTIASYRILHDGWSLEEATREMYAMGFHRWIYWWWVPRLKSVLNHPFR